MKLRSGSLVDVRSLRTFLSLNNFKLYCVALLQAFVAFGSDGAIVDKHVGAVVAPNEPVSLRVVKPLYRAFQSFHVRPLGQALPPLQDVPVKIWCNFDAIRERTSSKCFVINAFIYVDFPFYFVVPAIKPHR